MKFGDLDVNWADEFNGAVTVCNLEGIIVYMNQLSIQQFEIYGGAGLIGKNLLDCHPEPSKTKLSEMLKNPVNNVYTTEKNGVKKIIYQSPWKLNGILKGIVELSFQIEYELPHFVRK